MSLVKKRGYQRCLEQLASLCGGEVDVILKMATVVGVLHNEMELFDWTGFYRVVDGGLSIGPYQGTVACLRIESGRGVCGTAMREGRSQVVEDVNEFRGHIACDARSKSEIVVPVWDKQGVLLGVLDVDSTRMGAFDEVDQRCLEEMLAQIFS